MSAMSILRTAPRWGPLRNWSTSVKLVSPATNYVKHLSNVPQGPQDNKNDALSVKQKLKKAVTEYGSTVIVFHVTISLISLGTCYLIISSGVDVTRYLDYMGVSDGIASKFAGNAGTFAIAYGVHKVFAPVRLGITLTATPFIVRYLRSVGILKPK